MYKLLVKYNNFISTGLKILFSFTAVFFLWQQKYFRLFFAGGYPSVGFYFGFWLILFSIVNWFFEIKKWQSLVEPVQKIHFYDAFRQSLTAFSLSLLSPNRVGEFGVKPLFFEKKKAKKIFSLSVLGAFTQMSVSLFFGIISLVYLYYSGNLPQMTHLDISFVLPVIFLFVVVLLFVYFKRKFHFDFDVWKKSLHYSFLRYAVFSTQFVLLLHFFLPEISFRLLYQLVLLTYFFATLIPAFSFLDWAVKGSVAVWIAGLFEIHSPIIIKVVGLMWILNFFIPFLIGWWLILQHKSVLK